jgi:hypothetical protein
MKPSKSLQKMGLDFGPVKCQQDATSIGWFSSRNRDPWQLSGQLLRLIAKVLKNSENQFSEVYNMVLKIILFVEMLDKNTLIFFREKKNL